jgi:uncharacterized membrane protein
MDFKETIELVSKVVDSIGVAIIVAGSLFATASHLLRWNRSAPAELYRSYRQAIGRAILLGLEFLLAGDIIRTVALEPSLRSVGVLAIIVLIRTFLSLELELEIDGKWPWERRDIPGDPG